MKLQFCNLSPNLQHNFTVICQMRWSKNITEELESPKQILIGSNDERICVLLNLAIHIEMYGEMADSSSLFLYGNGIDGDRIVREILKSALGIKINCY